MAKLRMVHYGLILVGTPLLASIIFCVVLLSLLQQSEADLQHELTSRKVVAKAGELTHLYYSSLESIVIASQTGDPTYFERYDASSAALAKSLAELKKLVPPQSQQAKLINRIDQNSTKLLGAMSDIRRTDLMSTGLSDIAGLKGIARSKQIVSELVNDLGELAQSETRALEASPSRADSSRRNVLYFVILGVAANVIVAVSLTIFFWRFVAKRLAQLCEDTVRLVREEPLHTLSLADDEIGDLNRILHKVSIALSDARHKERALTTNAADVICSLDEKTVFVKVNPACKRIWGYEPEELCNRKLAEFVTDGSQLNLSKDSATNFETGFLNHSGSTIEMFWSANWSAQDELYFCVARDVSEKKLAERLKQQLIDMVSHDLRTPLTSINNILTLMAMQTYGPLTENALRKIEIAESETTRLISLVNNLLEFERLESGRMTLAIRPVKCGEVVQRSIDSIADIASSKSIALVPEIIDDVVIDLDEDRIIQVMINFLSNAIKFSESGSSIRVTVKQEEANLKFGVNDQGRGISAEDQSMLFNRFSQLRQTNAKDGAGLGLAICKHIIESHNGEIGVVSDGKSGSCFWFTLPVSGVSSQSPTTNILETSG